MRAVFHPGRLYGRAAAFALAVAATMRDLRRPADKETFQGGEVSLTQMRKYRRWRTSRNAMAKASRRRNRI